MKYRLKESKSNDYAILKHGRKEGDTYVNICF